VQLCPDRRRQENNWGIIGAFGKSVSIGEINE